MTFLIKPFNNILKSKAKRQNMFKHKGKGQIKYYCSGKLILKDQIHFQETTKNFKTEVPTDKNIEQNLKEIT